MNITGLFKYNGIFACRRKLNIIIGKIAEFSGLFAIDIIYKQIHNAVSVGYKINIFAYPHGLNILSRIIGDILNFFCFEIINPNIICHTTLVIFPCSELAENAVVSQFRQIGRIAAESSNRHW